MLRIDHRTMRDTCEGQKRGADKRLIRMKILGILGKLFVSRATRPFTSVPDRLQLHYNVLPTESYTQSGSVVKSVFLSSGLGDPEPTVNIF